MIQSSKQADVRPRGESVVSMPHVSSGRVWSWLVSKLISLCYSTWYRSENIVTLTTSTTLILWVKTKLGSDTSLKDSKTWSVGNQLQELIGRCFLFMTTSSGRTTRPALLNWSVSCSLERNHRILGRHCVQSGHVRLHCSRPRTGTKPRESLPPEKKLDPRENLCSVKFDVGYIQI